MTVFSALTKRPLRSLTLCFAVWKLILYLAILVSPGPGYDTSTLLLGAFQNTIDGTRTVQNRPELPTWGIYKLIRWDALYFTDIARRGRPFEQEWAFGYGYTELLSRFSAGLTISGLTSSLLPEALAGALLASTCHFLSVVVLYKLSQLVFSIRSTVQNQTLSFAVAALHIINPAGAFLAAPFSEAVFSLLNFTGFYAFLSGVGASHQPLAQDLKVLLAGTLFGLATTVRSNGILSGVLFAYAAVDTGLQTLSNGITARAIQRLLFVIFGGSLIALGAIYPQYVAYSEYCGMASEDVQLRPWCNARLPSIYSWVQSHYWKLGFLRYWTISNLPLFALATPMLLILFWSSLWTWKQLSPARTEDTSSPTIDAKLVSGEAEQIFNSASHSFIICLSLIQAALGFMTLTSAHVQIITRLASGYPLWYWWLGTALLRKGTSQRRSREAEWTVKWMVIYGSVQAGLFACFLPPA